MKKEKELRKKKYLKKLNDSKNKKGLMELNLIPNSPRKRLIMYLIIHALSIISLPILAIFIPFPYRYIMWILVFCLVSLTNIKAFQIHSERFPLNGYNEYRFNPFMDELNYKDDHLYCELTQKGKMYFLKLKNKTLSFDMEGCFFPITFIRAYIIRQFTMKCINKRKLVSSYMEKNINISNEFPKYRNILLLFGPSFSKEIWLIKNYKTKMNLFIKATNCRHIWHGTYSYRAPRYEKVSEQYFVQIKADYQKNKSKDTKD